MFTLLGLKLIITAIYMFKHTLIHHLESHIILILILPFGQMSNYLFLLLIILKLVSLLIINKFMLVVVVVSDKIFRYVVLWERYRNSFIS
jgi:hypothetical protein